jgi:hypothetical protein
MLVDEERSAWLLSRNGYYIGSWSYTRQQHTVDSVVDILSEHANTTSDTNDRMECIDME